MGNLPAGWFKTELRSSPGAKATVTSRIAGGGYRKTQFFIGPYSPWRGKTGKGVPRGEALAPFYFTFYRTQNRTQTTFFIHILRPVKLLKPATDKDF